MINDPSMKERVGVLLAKLRRINESGAKLAAICGGPVSLAYAGVPDGRRCTHSIEDPGEMFAKAIFSNEYFTVDRNMIIAQGQAYPEFAIEIGKAMGVYETEKEAREDLDWSRDRKGWAELI